MYFVAQASFKKVFAKTDGAIEYTDCFSAEE